MAKRILLVDDEPLILKGLKFSLEQDGYETDTAADGEEALAKMRNGGYDIVLLDVMLPKLSGIEVCQNIRETSNVPIIMLTAKGEDMDKILGLEYGADDYMTKPFNILEVKARIKSILRRTGAAPEAPKLELTVRDITINIGNRSVVAHGEPVNLTVKEFDLLQLFMNNPGKVYSRDELLETIWGFDYLGDVRTVDVHIRRLREKIEKDSTKPAYIMTKWGVGYYFAQEGSWLHPQPNGCNLSFGDNGCTLCDQLCDLGACGIVFGDPAHGNAIRGNDAPCVGACTKA